MAARYTGQLEEDIRQSLNEQSVVPPVLICSFVHTLCSFAGVGLGEGPVETLVAKARGSKLARARWTECKVLVIDEISMISGAFFDKLEAVARMVRRNGEPFGGIQLVLCGDFLQLPPVKSTKPTFRADCWERCIKRRIVLTQVFRQKDDPLFISLLANLRVGTLQLKEEALLKKAHYTQLVEQHGVIATKLNSLKRDTADENLKRLDDLPSKFAVFFKAYDSGKSEPHLDLLRKNCPAAEVLKLRVGAQVMLLKNLAPQQGLCNGSRGVVIDFVRIHSNGEETAVNGTGYAQEMLKSVGTAISSTAYWPDEKNAAFSGRAVQEDDSSTESGITLRNGEEVALLPRVKFDNGIVRVIESDRWSATLSCARAESAISHALSCLFFCVSREISVQEVLLASRRQVPLTLAWALTIHKSQGMTLDRAEINAQGMFENGQLYVAVSRVKSLKGLRLLNFTRDAMRTDSSVVAWYKQLERETLQSTRELLKEVDQFFPQLELQLAKEQLANAEEAARLKQEDETRRLGPFAQMANQTSAEPKVA